jgi:hypothetical protein
MNQQKDRNALRRELILLLKGLDFFRAWRLTSLKGQRVGIPEEDLVGEVVMSGSFFLQLFDETKGRRCTEILKEVRVWYSHASSDLNYLANLSEKDRSEVRQFFDDFQNNVGFSFHAEAGTLRKVADRALKRGKIGNEEEYYLLNELRNDLSQTVLKAEELASVSALFVSFEGRAEAS